MADNNIVIKIKSEADFTSAQKQLADYVKESERLEAELLKLKKAEEIEKWELKNSIKDKKELSARLIDLKNHYADVRDGLKGESEEVKKSIKTLNDQINAYKVLNGQSGRVVQQLRAMRERLMEMEDAGEFGTQAFMELSIAAGKLEDQIGDTQQRIRILSSDTKELDAVMGLGEGLAGSFYIATSAAEVFGEDMEGLQKAFYKVQAAMSVLSGTQQVFNALQKDSAVAVVFGNGLEAIKQKHLTKSAALERLYNIQKAKAASLTELQAEKTLFQTTVTQLWTKAQWKLNAAIAANPVGVAIAAVVALGAAVYGLVKVYQRFFTERGKAQADYEKSEKEYEQIHAKNAADEAIRQNKRQEQIRKTDNAENEALANAKARGASEIELASIKSKYAAKRAEDTRKYVNEELRLNNKEVEKLKEMRDAAAREAATFKDGTKRKKEALEKLTEAQNNYVAAVEKGQNLEQQRIDADQAEKDAAADLAEQRRQMARDAEQARIDLMKEGATKEIAQINFNYKEKLRTLKGGSKEEIALRKALEAQQAKEIAEVRKKYALQAQQAAIQEKKNELALLAQSTLGTEEDYQEQVQLTKEIAQEEAQARIDALDKEKMSEKDYKAQVEAIRLELANTLRDIDEQNIQRANENAKRLTEIAIQEAEAEKNALTGAEGVDEQKRVWDNYYAARAQQLKENANMEKEAINRSTESEEVKAAKIAQINNQLKADLKQNEKDAAQARIDIDAQYLGDLQREVEETQDAVDKAQFGGRLQALKENYDAQMSLYDAQMSDLKAKWDAGLITYEDYKQQEFEITKNIADAEVQYVQNQMQAISDGFQTVLGNIQQVSDLAFEALNNNVQAELDALDEEYTTDWEEAQKNADKKYITEEEYEKKKAALEMKQAKYAKAQALTNIGIQTALAIMNAMATAPFPINIVQAALAGAMGAAQLAIAAAKPLAQYEKGRNGGKGEYALVGEKGPEIMYIPAGASIVPNNKIADQDAWAKFGVPRLPLPETPHTDSELLRYAAEQTVFELGIDYDRLGASVAAAMPKQRNVTVNVDRSGVHVSDRGDYHTYLNAKYTGTWN